MLLAVQSGSGLAEGGGDHAVAGPIDLLCAGLAVGVAEVLIMGLVDLYLLRSTPCPYPCPAPWSWRFLYKTPDSDMMAAVCYCVII